MKLFINGKVVFLKVVIQSKRMAANFNKALLTVY